MKAPTPKIAGIGEILWDMLPNGGRLGGAPNNFACHCQQLGGESYPVSCVGDDALGKRALAELEQLGVSSKFVQQVTTHLTGQVQISLNMEGKATYQILVDMAWDHLHFTPELRNLAASLDAICFGSLAQRFPVTRETIRLVLQEMPEKALRIFDINLRAPFYSREQIEESLGYATVLKLSDDELPVLSGYYGLEGSPIARLTALRERFDLDLVAYTRGANGSVLIGANETDETPGIEIDVVDSIGAGDSFTAALCMGLLNGWPLSRTNQFANQVAAFVCSQNGATPKFPAELSLTHDQ